MAAIDVARLTIRYGELTAVRDLSFTAEAGAVTCVLGRNGAGKTSTIEALEGLRRPTEGRLAVLGLDPQRDHTALVARVGVMLQDVGIHPAVRAGEIVRHAAALYPDPLDPPELLERVGLGGFEGRTFRRLSGGEQRRLALALALVGRPEVVFLDEPTTGVDPAGRQLIRDLVRGLRDSGVTVLLSTHELDEAERVADRVVVIDRGKLRAEGTLDELTRGAGEVRFRAEPGVDTRSMGAELAAQLDGLTVVTDEVGPGEYRIDAAPTPALIAAVTAWLARNDLPLSDLHTGRRRLEDVFLELTDPTEAAP
ncbi:MAG: ABC transporter ATP-binding protein [Acidimicrobiales bacterium]